MSQSEDQLAGVSKSGHGAPHQLVGEPGVEAILGLCVQVFKMVAR